MGPPVNGLSDSIQLYAGDMSDRLRITEENTDSREIYASVISNRPF